MLIDLNNYNNIYAIKQIYINKMLYKTAYV